MPYCLTSKDDQICNCLSKDQKELAACLGFEGLQGLENRLSPQFLFFLGWQAGVAQDVDDAPALDDAVRANHFGHG